jgi:parallel beta-helix repeat protein
MTSDGVIVNNWIEGAIDGFFFEISRGATVAGNIFVRCDKGIRVLNSADVHVYNNTFVDTPASFERNQRSKTNDHFGWHPATGPDVDQREGHVFVNNLLVASDSYSQALLRFEQPKTLCDTLTRPMAKVVNGNVYVRRLHPAPASLPCNESPGTKLRRRSHRSMTCASGRPHSKRRDSSSTARRDRFSRPRTWAGTNRCSSFRQDRAARHCLRRFAKRWAGTNRMRARQGRIR